jgi:hypothetical protein
VEAGTQGETQLNPLYSDQILGALDRSMTGRPQGAGHGLFFFCLCYLGDISSDKGVHASIFACHVPSRGFDQKRIMFSWCSCIWNHISSEAVLCFTLFSLTCTHRQYFLVLLQLATATDLLEPKISKFGSSSLDRKKKTRNLTATTAPVTKEDLGLSARKFL